ncbi:PAS domain S-box protein [Oryzomonas sagensis]|uniref:histidine kinase n=1 Tax=Oryzomonas sagensis TaxID=2603857 RepID=A0ABQ6TNS5_9BACT|nr:PAS domain S-box protein [Oryzomonas sagensis]KAB0670303.1 PAS domain S-box protein [Oryzomonas sagensis]
MSPAPPSVKTVLFFIIGIVALPCVGIIIHTGLHHRDEVIGSAGAETRRVVGRIVSEQQNLTAATEQLMATLGRLPEVADEDAARTGAILKSLVELNPQYANLLIADHLGNVWCSGIPAKLPLAIADRRHFRNALASGRLSSSEYLIGRTTNRPAISYAYPYRGRDGAIAGVIVATLNLDFYQNIVEQFKLPPQAGLLLVDHRGVIIYASREARPQVGTPLRADLFRQMVRGPEEATGSIDSMAGDRRIASYRKLRLKGEAEPYLYARVTIPYAAALAAADTQFLVDVALLSAFLLLAAGAAYLVGTRLIIRRISVLTDASQRLAEGERKIRVAELVRGGELGALGQTFDHMAEQLERRESALRESEGQMRVLFESSQAGIVLLDAACTIMVANGRLAEMLGRTPEELTGSPYIDHLPPDQRSTCRENLCRIIDREIDTISTERRYLRKDGSVFWGYFTGRRYEDDHGGLIGVVGHISDISEIKHAEEERRKIEQQMLHAQKLEGLGVLAGGIAHDFNNILMAIIGNADLALMRINRESPCVENLHKIEEAAARAADLAKQMLAYSGKGKFLVESIDLNRILEDMVQMLEVSISKKALLRLNLCPELAAVEADATQLRQVVMNLVINASEAIGDRDGVIAITTGCMECDEAYLKDAWLNESIGPGPYVWLEIADTGCGMDRETMAKIFDPFFTTKFTGRGLGMAAVLGIIRGHRGTIKVYSEPGRGTTFKVLLPVAPLPAELPAPEPLVCEWHGSGTVLLADDEKSVRSIGREMLKALGYTPVTAADGREAVELCRSTPGIVFAILDLTMPNMDGEQCFRELRRLDPGIRVIMSSGYNKQDVAPRFAGKGLDGFIQKPYTIAALREAVSRLGLANPGDCAPSGHR